MAARVQLSHKVTIDIDGATIKLLVRRIPMHELSLIEQEMQALGFSLDGQFRAGTAPDDQARAEQWLAKVISENVKLPPGELEVEDDEGGITSVLTGAELLTLFGGRSDILPQLVGIVYGENKIPEAKKQEFRAELQAHLNRGMGIAEPSVTVADPRDAVEPVRRRRRSKAEMVAATMTATPFLPVEAAPVPEVAPVPEAAPDLPTVVSV